MNKLIRIFLSALLFIVLLYAVFFAVFKSTYKIYKKEKFSKTDSINQARLRNVQRLQPQNYDVLLKGEGTQAELNIYKAYYRAVIEMMPQNANAYTMLGLYYSHKNDLDQAKDNFEKAAELAPDVFWNYYNLVFIYGYLGQYQDAVAALKKVIKLDLAITVQKIFSSRVYQQIIADQGFTQDLIISQLKASYGELWNIVRLLSAGQKIEELFQSRRLKYSPKVL